jgi:hypothetical protein
MAGITSTKKIKGQPHLLAYITPNEVEKLKALGGQETMTKEGIPAYPEYDNYGYSNAKDFKEGNKSKSTDPNVNRESTFETYRGGKNIGVDNTLKQKSLERRAKEAKDAKEKARLEKEAKEIQKSLDKGQTYGYGKNQTGFQKVKTYFSNKQRKANLDLAKKRAFQKYKDVEQYVDPFDDYTMSGQKMSELRGYTFDDQGNITGYDRDKATAYGYDTSKLAKGMDTLTSNKGTSIEKTRPNLYDVNSYAPGLLGMGVNKIRPDTQRTVLNTLGKAAEYNVLGINAPNMTNQEISDEMYRLKNLGRTQDQINFIEGGGGGGGGGQEYLPYLPPEEDDEEETTFDYRFGDNEFGAADVRRGSYIFNQGGRVPRAFGGIMDTATGRKAYGLGSIFKSVKKAASKVLKSPLGKAAILGLGGYALGGGFTAGGFGSNALGGFMKSIGQKALLKDGMTKFTLGNLHLGKLGILGASALPFFMKQPENPDIGMADRGGSLIDPLTGKEATPAEMRANINFAVEEAAGDPIKLAAIDQKYNNMLNLVPNTPYPNYALFASGGRVPAQEGGLMNLGGMEKDYRAEGGFVPIGKQEKADDVPARLSVNEFVFTADAVRNAGGGDIDKGAEVMENMMKNLENGGTVSEESQGNTGAQEMFSVSERIGEVI